MESEMDIIMDDFVDHLSFDNDEDSKIAEGEDKNYYIAKGEFILKQLDDKDNYFHFLSSILTTNKPFVVIFLPPYLPAILFPG